MTYCLAIDQSTQGTKVFVLDENAVVCHHAAVSHRQIVTGQGWVSHDLEEIYAAVRTAAAQATRHIDRGQITRIALTNQRETACLWHRDGHPLAHAVVWQCRRVQPQVDRLAGDTALASHIKAHTGLPLSPYYAGPKFAWLREHVEGAAILLEQGAACLGTVDSYLIYRLTGNYLTDVTNASRTMLMSLSSCTWDDRICQAFGLQSRWLARIVPCDHDFGRTDLDGLLPRAVPILAVMGDSHAAFYAQHCTKPGDTKATYGTGSSVMMHIGDAPKSSTDGIVTSVGYQYRGKTVYAYEGNINDSGAVITWLKDRVGLICSPDETEALALAADPEDVTCLVPAFSGLSAPYHDPDASAIYTGMSRLTGRNELVRAALDSIAFQIRDITACMEAQAGLTIQTLHADGGAAQNRYLMQFQSDLLGRPVHVSAEEDLSAYGVGLMALALEPCADVGTEYTPLRDDAFRQKKCAQWAQAVAQCRRH